MDKMQVLLTVTTNGADVARQAVVAPEDQSRVAADSRLRMFADRAVRAVLDPQCANLHVPMVNADLTVLHRTLADLPLPGAPEPSSYTLTFRFSPATAESCENDWRACADNSDLANNFTGMTSARVACRETANEQAKFGTPIWPGFWSGGAFGHFEDGNSYILIGKALLIEPDAQFQNEYGAMAHKYVVCLYDLSTKTVIRVNIMDR